MHIFCKNRIHERFEEKIQMNLNEECLLNYLQNPNELETLTAVLEENIGFVSDPTLFSVLSI